VGRPRILDFVRDVRLIDTEAGFGETVIVGRLIRDCFSWPDHCVQALVARFGLSSPSAAPQVRLDDKGPGQRSRDENRAAHNGDLNDRFAQPHGPGPRGPGAQPGRRLFGEGAGKSAIGAIPRIVKAEVGEKVTLFAWRVFPPDVGPRLSVGHDGAPERR